jgi:hypothetical protein
MVELVVSICLLGNPEKCHEESLVFADVPMMTCMVSGQPMVALHMEKRPRWFVKRWSCQIAGQFAKI